MRHSHRHCRPPVARFRHGAMAVEYVLVLCVLLPMTAFAIWASLRIIRLVYEVLYVFIAWPLM